MESKGKRGAKPAPAPAPVVAIAAPETAEVAIPEPVAAATAPVRMLPPPRPARPAGGDAFSAVMESQAAVLRGLQALSAEMAGLAGSGIEAAARTASGMLAARTLADAVEINTGFARHSFDALVAGSAKLSEIGLRVATEASRPLLSQFGEGRKAAR